MNKTIILLRHTESTKNTEDRFSKEDDTEELTYLGLKQSQEIAKNIREYLSNNSLNLKLVCSANSNRSVETGKIIKEILNYGKNITLVEEFKSFNIGKNAGISENELKKKEPKLYHELRLYRHSVLNSYNIHFEEEKETSKEFEQKVVKKMNEIVGLLNKDDCAIVIMHRSALTAFLINIARQEYGYPEDFYGYIELSLGNISLIKYSNKRYEILYINENPETLSKIKI